MLYAFMLLCLICFMLSCFYAYQVNVPINYVIFTNHPLNDRINKYMLLGGQRLKGGVKD